MKESLPISDEILSAYIDGEIDGDELDRIIAMEAADKSLAARICEMRKLKGVVKAARSPEPEYISSNQLKKLKNKNHLSFKRKRIIVGGLAASLALVFMGMISGFIDLVHPDARNHSEMISIDEKRLLAEVSKKPNINLVMHLKSKDLSQAELFLNLLESALIKLTNNKNNLHVEVIVSGPGLHLLQTNSLLDRNKIRLLKQKYQNLTFLACGKTLQNLQEKSGKEIQIIDEAMLIASGPQWVKKRKASGWSYFLI